MSQEPGPGPGMRRALSARSEAAVSQLALLNTAMASYEEKFKNLVVETAESPEVERVLAIKNELAVMVGEVDKLQMTGIDAVMVSDLGSGKDEARGQRKDLNKRAATLSERIKELHAAIVRHIDAQKEAEN